MSGLLCKETHGFPFLLYSLFFLFHGSLLLELEKFWSLLHKSGRVCLREILSPSLHSPSLPGSPSQEQSVGFRRISGLFHVRRTSGT
jgi:hypothetical protein